MAKFSYNVTNDPTRILIKKVDEEGNGKFIVSGSKLAVWVVKI